jgi:hypothetical protein
MQEYNVKPFYVVVDGEENYFAAFHAAYSSLGRIVPYFNLLGVDWSQNSVLVLQKFWNDPDMRSDPRIKRVLKELGIYEGGS